MSRKITPKTIDDQTPAPKPRLERESAAPPAFFLARQARNERDKSALNATEAGRNRDGSGTEVEQKRDGSATEPLQKRKITEKSAANSRFEKQYNI